MREDRVFQLSSRTGYCTVVHDNLVTINVVSQGYLATVEAHRRDHNLQVRTFKTAEEAVEWARGAATEHRGEEQGPPGILHWELRSGHSITITVDQYGNHRLEILPVWVDSDHEPVFGHPETFKTLPEAIGHAREVVDEEARNHQDYRNTVRQIRAALESTAELEGTRG